MATRQDAIRKLYEANKGEDFWREAVEWAEGPDKWRERWSRFRALQRFAQGHRDNSAGDEREMWNARRKYARRRKRRIWEHAHEPEPTNTGCGSCGSPAWGGAQSILMGEVKPIADAAGVPVSSNKRSWASGSDHCTCTPCASAFDLATYSGAGLAAKLGQHFGFPFTPVGTYQSSNIVRCGKTFRVQILWAVSGHFDHVHCGIRYIGAAARVAHKVPVLSARLDKRGGERQEAGGEPALERMVTDATSPN